MIDKMAKRKQDIIEGKTSLGIEFGSTRIKAVLLNDENETLASGAYEWENQYINGIWTYSLEEIWLGIQGCYQAVRMEVEKKYGVVLHNIGAIGISGMMHGYMAFDKEGALLVPFRTWRNTMTEEASNALTTLFAYNIPQRWSVAHLYQSILNGEEHVSKIAFQTTLAGYIHWKLTGEKVLGIGEASGMFPIDIETKKFDKRMIQQFQNEKQVQAYEWKLQDILPEVLLAGDAAGCLSDEGAALLDPSGQLASGIPCCPPEGDAGTGMVATNSITKRTGNVSAGTSVFAMVVLEQQLQQVHKELDLVTTPDGSLVAMVHCNNCTSELNAWISIFEETLKLFGAEVDKNLIYEKLYMKALEGEVDAGGLLAYNYHSGEHITGLEEGRPLLVRKPDSAFNLANFMRVQLYTSLGALKVGMDILLKEEGVEVDQILGHGGLFKTQGVGQRILAGAINTPVAVMETAGEGGPWGMAILASYMRKKSERETLEHYLANSVFQMAKAVEMKPLEMDVEGYASFIETYKNGIEIEKQAVIHML